MPKKVLPLLLLAFCAAPLFAGVELQTSINDVFYRGSAELTGSITMTVNDESVWDYGSYVLCSGEPVSIFFPYLPKFNDPVDPPTFWVGLSYVNQGVASFGEGEVAMIAYDEDGVRYENTNPMPALPITNQMTWLLWDNAGVVEIRGAGTNNSGWLSNFSPAGYGGTRSSMFVTGNFVADNLGQVYYGDLDGYLLIGSFENNAVDGAYLPRNYDNDLPGQNADLPLYRDKRVIDGNRAIKRDYPARYGLKNGHSR